ncbi:MAG TPA: sigma-70 family RNA polymerase sigma factor [Jatrophihabitans sp.]|nr:sigma-70 family RNA polymerase sigma factor [Jatrophihabitans sp.]
MSEALLGEGTLSVGDAPTEPDLEDAFDAWVAPHLPVLSALAIHQVGAAAADDVVQETLLRAWQRRETFDPARGSPRAWLVGVLIDRSRRHRVRVRPFSRAMPAGNPEPQASDATSRLDVERAVRRLPARQRQTVVLHYLADLPVAEVAGLLRITEGAVKAQLHDARAKLRLLLENTDD